MTSHEVYARLITLRKRAGRVIFERVRLADTLLSDNDWVSHPEHGGGDQSVAIDRLEADAFGDLCGAVSLPDLLEIYHHVPREEDWRKAKFNLRRLHAEVRARLRPKPPKTPAVAEPRRENTRQGWPHKTFRTSNGVILELVWTDGNLHFAMDLDTGWPLDGDGKRLQGQFIE